MGNYVSEQLALFLQSIALGAVLALIYDLLGVLRSLGGRIWGGVLDVLFCLISLTAVFIFTMAGDGELRVFMVLGNVGGAVLFWCLLSGLLRPVWAFWLNLVLKPVRVSEELLKKSARLAKKSCTFLKKWVTIKMNMFRRPKPPEPQEGDEGMAAASASGKARAPKKKPKPPKAVQSNSKLTMILVVFLLAVITVQIFHMFDQLQAARAEEAAYAQQLAELQETNQKLKDDLANSESLDLIEDIARDQLGMVREGEKVFHYGK